jgi:hypothetical protein
MNGNFTPVAGTKYCSDFHVEGKKKKEPQSA